MSVAHTHTHTCTHTERTEGDGGRTSIHGCQIQAILEMFVCVSMVSVCVFKCPGAGGWESVGVKKAFFPLMD